jgi:hypothetical protein
MLRATGATWGKNHLLIGVFADKKYLKVKYNLAFSQEF